MVALTITCGPSPDAKLPGYASGEGGATSTGTGGATATGGTTAIGAGGLTGTGGSSVVGNGGKPGSGGAPGSGGRDGTGGSPGGASGTGGSSIGTGGAGTGGAGTGGSTASTGGAGGLATGGTTGTQDAAPPPPDSAGNCLGQVISNNYACGDVPPCSACKDNSTSKSAECQAVINCIEASYPCTGNCTTECFNKNGGNAPVQVCVKALQAAACGATGCGSTPPPNGGG
ncbi:MAG TPA: hypothetical protein VF524_02445 [Polyangia bacterium]